MMKPMWPIPMFVFNVEQRECIVREKMLTIGALHFTCGVVPLIS
jgi:hypothetical protein